MKGRGIKNGNESASCRLLHVLSGGVLGLNTLCRGCSSHMTLVGLLYPKGDKSENIEPTQEKPNELV